MASGGPQAVGQITLRQQNGNAERLQNIDRKQAVANRVKPCGNQAAQMKTTVKERLAEVGIEPVQNVMDSIKDYEAWFNENKENMPLSEQHNYHKQKMSIYMKLMEYSYSKAVTQHQTTKVNVNHSEVMKTLEKQTLNSEKVVADIKADMVKEFK